MSLYWHSNVTNEIVSVLPTPCGSVLSWAHILFSLVLGCVCLTNVFKREEKNFNQDMNVSELYFATEIE